MLRLSSPDPPQVVLPAPQLRCSISAPLAVLWPTAPRHIPLWALTRCWSPSRVNRWAGVVLQVVS
ncbi:hypothetical protein OG598_08020 [Micromonospora sp. NBC_00330]|nr:hypothetical protein [Micromonospora sp. NBC_00330]